MESHELELMLQDYLTCDNQSSEAKPDITTRPNKSAAMDPRMVYSRDVIHMSFMDVVMSV